MQEHAVEFDAESVTRAWDRAAEAYAHGQAIGRDYYRYEFLGPAQIAVCGDVKGLQMLDVGCGAGYFAREMARHQRPVAVKQQVICLRPVAAAERQETTDLNDGTCEGLRHRTEPVISIQYHSEASPGPMDNVSLATSS